VTKPYEKDLWGHPRGLFVLFLTEMWERFSYYGMRALLVYYMIKHLTFSQGQASHIYGLYTGFVYLTPLFGGILADRYWGQRKTVIVGAVLMAIGHFLMAFEFLFFPALLFLILGNGAFKPNISTQVGNLYRQGDPRRDRAFSIFYVGINLGAFFSPLVCGTLGEVYGWHYGFSAAGIGMVLGLVIYLAGQRWLAPDYLHRMPEKTSHASPDESNQSLDGTDHYQEEASSHSSADRDPARVETHPALTGDEKTRVWSLIALCLISVAFWAAFEQQGNTVALWADSYTDRHILGWEFPASWIQSLNPAFVFLCTPLITTLWAWQSRKGKEPSAVAKMAIGCSLLAVGFVVMVPAAISYASGGTPVSVLWVIVFTLMATLGELYLSPVGLSLVTKVAPVRIVSMMMGTWFLSSFFGNYAAGFLGRYWNVMSKDLFFLMFASIGLVAGVTIFLLLKPMKRAMGAERIR
jgi:POT family proton-dependent oligopeptide transporter